MTTMPWRITIILVASVIDLDTNSKVVTNKFIDLDNILKITTRTKRKKHVAIIQIHVTKIKKHGKTK
jgi:hypothetical protein